MVSIDTEFSNLIPPLSKEEKEQLTENVKNEGCRDPLIVWQEKGILLDGHHRFGICRQFNLPYKTKELSFKDRDDAKIWVIKNQFGRRNLTPFVRSELALKLKPLIADKAKANQAAGGGDKRSDEAKSVQQNSAKPINPVDTRKDLATIAGVSHDTIAKTETIKNKGSSELQEAARKGEISINAAAEIAELPKETQAKVLKEDKPEILKAAKAVKTQKAKERKANREEAKAKAVQENHPLAGKSYKLIAGDLIESSSEIKDGSIDAIITDPPYPEEFIPEYGKLCKLAERVLRSGGHLLVMTGQANLPKILSQMQSDGLTYQWTLCYFTPGQSTQCFGRKVKSNWKPVLWFTKGKNGWEHVEDIIKSDANDKRYHEWGQSVSGMAQLIERFTTPKSLILDPFCGAGTTGIAAIKTDRLFIGIDIDSSNVSMAASRLSEVA